MWTQQFVLCLPALAPDGLVTRRYMVPGRGLGLRAQAPASSPSLLCGSEQAQLPLCGFLPWPQAIMVTCVMCLALTPPPGPHGLGAHGLASG